MAFWYYDVFLENIYDTKQHSIQVAANVYGTNKNFAKNIADTIDSGYALSLSCYNEIRG